MSQSVKSSIYTACWRIMAWMPKPHQSKVGYTAQGVLGHALRCSAAGSGGGMTTLNLHANDHAGRFEHRAGTLASSQTQRVDAFIGHDGGNQMAVVELQYHFRIDGAR